MRGKTQKSSDVHSKMDRSLVSDAERMRRSVRMFLTRGTNGITQRLAKEVLAGDRFDCNEFVRMRGFERLFDSFKDRSTNIISSLYALMTSGTLGGAFASRPRCSSIVLDVDYVCRIDERSGIFPFSLRISKPIVRMIIRF
jgi:hypothetical protein